MSHHHKLSFWSAILVNLNVMFGAGIFVNTISLAKLSGFFGYLSYFIVAVILLPLIISMARLLNYFPDGGFYTYATKTINPLAGFFSAWAYFTGKLASAALLIHIFSSLIISIIPNLPINPFVFDVIIICLFTLLNLWHMKAGKNIMYAFMFFKITPILFAICSCLYLYNYWTIPPTSLMWNGIPTTIPLVLFAFVGFEACCSLSSSLENAKVNGPRVLFISYALVVCITIIYQFLFFITAGQNLLQQTDFLGIFPALFQVLTPNNPVIAAHLISLLYIALACASLGGSYGILFSNHWNLYALAKNNHTFFAHTLQKLNNHYIPTVCVLTEAFFCILYLIVSQGTVVILQQISVLGCSIAYLLSIIGLLVYNKNNNNAVIQPWIVYSALASCMLFVFSCIRNFYLNGITALVIFSCILIFGLCMYAYTKKNAQIIKQ